MMNKKITVLATLIFIFSLMSVGATESVTDTAVIPVTATVKEKMIHTILQKEESLKN